MDPPPMPVHTREMESMRQTKTTEGLEERTPQVSGPLCAQMPPEGIVLSEDVNVSQVGYPSQTLRNEGTLAV